MVIIPILFHFFVETQSAKEVTEYGYAIEQVYKCQNVGAGRVLEHSSDNTFLESLRKDQACSFVSTDVSQFREPNMVLIIPGEKQTYFLIHSPFTKKAREL